jgi:PPOX class probable F420-dependent enzyme
VNACDRAAPQRGTATDRRVTSNRLDKDTCWTLVAGARHGVLATVHAVRGADAVPVVFGLLAGPRIVVPVDAVKPKQRTRLQRVINVERDPRCVLLVDHYEDDWERLWWVRIHATAEESPVTIDALDALTARYPRYGVPGALVTTLVLVPTTVTGWAAGRL